MNPNGPTLWGSIVTVEVSSADPDSLSPVWVDISEWVLMVRDIIVAGGRQTELSGDEPRQMELALNNRDGRFTIGNSSSPYYPWWKQARRIRIREVIGVRAFDLFDGFIEMPQETAVTQVVGDADSDVTVTLTAVDILGRAQRARTLISTAAERILANGADALEAYWPLVDTDGPFARSASIAAIQPDLRPRVTPGRETLVSASLTFGVVEGLPGDDGLKYPLWTQHLDGLNTVGNRSLHPVTSIDAFGLTSGTVLTVAVWARLASTAGADDQNVLSIAQNSLSPAPLMSIRRDASTGSWMVLLTYNGVNYLSLYGPYAAVDTWTHFAVRMRTSPNLQEFWVDEAVSSNTAPGAFGTSQTFDLIEVGAPWGGSIAHVQVYLGDEDSYTHDEHLAQSQLVRQALARQPGGDRINDLADYIGVPAGYRDIDPGVAIMQPANLAGRRPTDALTEAVTTEQGRLLVTGGGRLTFRDRRRLYNI